MLYTHPLQPHLETTSYAQSAAARVEGTLRALSGGISNGSSVVMRGYCESPDLLTGSVAVVAAAKQDIEQDIEQQKLLLTVEKPGNSLSTCPCHPGLYMRLSNECHAFCSFVCIYDVLY